MRLRARVDRRPAAATDLAEATRLQILIGLWIPRIERLRAAITSDEAESLAGLSAGENLSPALLARLVAVGLARDEAGIAEPVLPRFVEWLDGARRAPRSVPGAEPAPNVEPVLDSTIRTPSLAG